MKKGYRKYIFLLLCLILIFYGCNLLPSLTRDGYGDKGPEPTGSQTDGPSNSAKPIAKPTAKARAEKNHHDALFIGDSNTVLFMYHVFREREKDPSYMEDTIFLAKKSLGIRHVEEESFTKCDGTEWMLYDLLKTYSFNRIYIMLGTNDIGYYKDINRTIFNYKRLLNNITAMAEADIYIQSILPLGKKLKNHKYLNNDWADQVNREIAKYGERLGCYYLDIASCFRDTNGDLDKKYSEDGLHLDRNAMPLWADYIMENTRH